jgi:uncharacterized protein YkwD
MSSLVDTRRGQASVGFGLLVGTVGCLLIWQSSALETVLRGDLNGDGKVGVQDLSILLSKYNTDSPEADLTGDGKVGVADLSVLLSKYGSAATPTPTPPPTPTPTQPPATPPAGPRPVSELASETECPGQSNGNNPPEQQEDALICMVNIARRHHGLAVVAKNTVLMRSSASKASDIEACGFSHTACDRDFSYWFRQYGFKGTCTSENIARGHKSAHEVMTGWLQSPGHRVNIMNASHTEVGVRRLNSLDAALWVQHFGCR